MFRLRPPKTKYHDIWYVEIMLEFLKNVFLGNAMDVRRKLVCLAHLLVQYQSEK